jgi:hypothetical protein
VEGSGRGLIFCPGICLEDVEEDLRKMRIGGWRGKARRRDEWKSVLREVKVLQGP